MVLACIFAEAISNLPNVSTTDMKDTKNATRNELVETEYGYRYGNTSVSDILSVLVITIYCVVVLGYIVYTIHTGHTSTAWNSPVDIIASALGSTRPDYLGHASVGIDSVETLGESVGIRVNQQDEVELVFANGRDVKARGLRKIERNRAY
ncbi:hypothetical protein DM02DRAFT_659169 [Periconia macrospinosa]|uniref:Uncharacterized protein n=1 Tax=Periconia macrospinosa TaxID=97972 RepID=A0A2V1DEE6_9PLEO|nr:hypothetical protein DM02DRAFT_659169 [Periconia macrospinosa]